MPKCFLNILWGWNLKALLSKRIQMVLFFSLWYYLIPDLKILSIILECKCFSKEKKEKKRIKTKSLAFDHNQQHLLSIWKHSTSPYIHLKLLNTAEQRMKNTTERTGLWPNCFGKRCSVERSVKQADSTEETRVSLTLILGKTTEHIRKGTLRQCTSAPPYPLT